MPRKKKKNDGDQDMGLEEGMEETGDSASTKRGATGASDGDELNDGLVEDPSEDDDLLMDEADEDEEEDEY